MRNFLLIFIFLLSSCGYQPLYSNKNSNKFIFKEIKILGDKNINRNLIASAFIKQDEQNFIYEKLILENSKKIIETSKNSKGQPESYRMIIDLEVTLINEGKTLKNKKFAEEFSYKNLDNKFDLHEYEINVQNNLIDKITEELIIYLNL
tara:strand:+ start:36 stop:482 length:447 start_codon:yes stop_codon:yes gene_type:complete